MSAYNIGIIGAGNVGSHLARAFSNAGHKITVFTRRGATHLLSDVHPLVWTEHLHTLKRGFDFVIIAVNDHSIEEVAKELKLEEGILLHTSGSTDIEILKKSCSQPCGVFYPLQSFQKDRSLNYKEIPVFVESTQTNDLAKIQDLAKAFSGNTVEMDSSQRKRLHLSAVIVNNFTNHLYRLSQDYLNLHKLSFQHLVPLIKETAARLEENNASEMQTGPAKRKDQEILDEHMQMLKEYPEIMEIYKLMSDSISNHYHSH